MSPRTRDQKIVGQMEVARSLRAIHITPLAGPLLMCIADDVDAIDVTKTPDKMEDAK
jgi:hypothetical protein